MVLALAMWLLACSCLQRKSTAAALKLFLSCGGITKVWFVVATSFCRLASIILPHLLFLSVCCISLLSHSSSTVGWLCGPSRTKPLWAFVPIWFLFLLKTRRWNPEVRRVGTGHRKHDSSAFVLGSCSSVIKLERLGSD